MVRGATIAATVALLGALATLVYELDVVAAPAIGRFGAGFLVGTTWAPNRNLFGAAPALAGTLETSALAMLFAVPLAVGFAILLSEFAPRWIREPLTYAVDLSAAIPSIVYGYWGFLILVPLMGYSVEPFFATVTGGFGPFSGTPSGLDVLTASVVLAAMILPTITSLSREALQAVPRAQRESALSLGATRWEATRMAVLRPAAPGIFAAMILGLARALGETVAVALTIGGIYAVPSSLLAGGSTLSSQIAAGLPGAYPGTLERSALVELGLILLATTLLVNALARYLLFRVSRAKDEAETPGRWPAFSRKGGRRHRWSIPLPTGARLPPASTPPWRTRALGNAPARERRRRTWHVIVLGLTIGAAAVSLLPLYSVIHQSVVRGGQAILTPTFYTTGTAPPCANVPGIPCELGGIGPAIEGSLLLIGMASAIALPLGVLAGIYLAEFGRHRVARGASFVVEVMAGIPSILIGIFVYILFVQYDHNLASSAYSAALALGLVMIPIVTRGTEEALRSVPVSVREAALALGFPRHRVATRVVLGASRTGLITGALLAVARASGETAAVLFTAGSGGAFITDPQQLNGGVGTLPTLIFNLGQNGYSNWQMDAWGATLVLLLIMLAISLVARVGLRKPLGAGDVM
ncbi:MAG TPA: phosphate ABC transporter permease subunit PstC [Thermoplasmata archaeon]|nr:phosphate ABC transporter permease subunit PstC [Thermoplasmata archaeon]